MSDLRELKSIDTNGFQRCCLRGELRKHLLSTVTMTVPSEFNEVRMQQLLETLVVSTRLEAMELEPGQIVYVRPTRQTTFAD